MRYRKEGCFTNDEHRQIQDQILNVIEQGTLSKEETLRRLDQLIENEINVSDRAINLYLVDACQALMWAISTDNKPLPAFDAKRSYKGIRNRIRREAQQEKAQQLLRWGLPKLIPMAAILLLVVVLAGGGIHLAWFTNYSTPDEQQYIVRGNEITVEMVQSALAEERTTELETVYTFHELCSIVPFMSNATTPSDQWKFNGGSVRYLRTHVSITLQYTNTENDSQTITYSLKCYGTVEDAYIAFEQSQAGSAEFVNGYDIYITVNEDRHTVVWNENSTVYSISGNMDDAMATELIRELTE